MFKLLIVDDEPEIADSLEPLIIENCKYSLEIDKEYLPAKAIKKATTKAFDILLTDMRMPGMTGIEMAEKIRAIPINKNIKIIFLTGYSDFDSLYKINKEGNARYILKNEDDSVIIKELEKLIDNMPTDQILDRLDRDDDAVHIIESSKKYIQENLDKDLSLNALAERVNMNPSYFSRLFKKETGQNLSVYIQNTRISSAKHLIEKGNLKIIEIGEKLGFDSPAYFTTYFKKATGYTPQQYKDGCLAKKLNIK